MKRLFLLSALVLSMVSMSFAASFDTFTEFQFSNENNALINTRALHYDFKGYSDYWNLNSWTWYANNGLFLTLNQELSSARHQLEMAIGNKLLLEELWIQKGFIGMLDQSDPVILESPSEKELRQKLSDDNILVIAMDRDPIMRTLNAKIPLELRYRRNRAFYLRAEKKTILVIAGQTREEAKRLFANITSAQNVIDRYSLHKGLAGVHSNYLMITPAFNHNPYDLIGKAMQISCSWVMLSGYNDQYIPESVNNSLQEIQFPFEFYPGQYVTGGVLYGMQHYPDVQDNTISECLDFADINNGFYFSNLSGLNDESNPRYSGYIVTSPSQQALIDSLDAPFFTNAGTIYTDPPPTMVLFIEKNVPLNQQTIMKAIMEKKAVAVFANGQMLGPKDYLDPLRILLMEQDFLQKHFNDLISVDAKVKNDYLHITVQNRTASSLNADITFKLSPGIIIGENLKSTPISLAANETREINFKIHCTDMACGKDNPIGVVLKTPQGEKRCLAHISIPNPVEIHPLILDVPEKLSYPVTIWNYTDDRTCNVTCEIMSTKEKRSVFLQNITVEVNKWEKKESTFTFKLNPGEYIARVTSLGKTSEGKISIKSQKSTAFVHEEDLNNDEIPEIILENSKIRATILLFGGRVIEYILKKRNENLLFKLWPEKPPWADEPRGYRAFYPYGGLEEFIGYRTIGGHIIFNYEILQDSGPYVRVRVWSDIHGSKINKIITLYADSEVLEVRYAFDDMVSNINMIGINPLVEIGPSTGPEDVYYFPMQQIEERRT